MDKVDKGGHVHLVHAGGQVDILFRGVHLSDCGDASMTKPNFTRLVDEYSKHCTDRQRLILQLSRQGWSSRRIALTARCSHTTVLMELDRAIVTMTRYAEGNT